MTKRLAIGCSSLVKDPSFSSAQDLSLCVGITQHSVVIPRPSANGAALVGVPVGFYGTPTHFCGKIEKRYLIHTRKYMAESEKSLSMEICNTYMTVDDSVRNDKSKRANLPMFEIIKIMKTFMLNSFY
jgi:hypothetical protein